ncbi:MAG: DUF4886 domain-containing protein, partial [Planctomycetota bacterium]
MNNATTARLIALVVFVCPGAAEAQNILFFGNSYSGFFAGQRSVPDLVEDLAAAAGHEGVVAVDATRNGRDFAWHLGFNLGPIDDGIGADEDWDVVVMQNFSTRPTLSHPAGNRPQHRLNAVALYQAVANRSPMVRPVLFQTWARAEGSPDLDFFAEGQAQMLGELRDGYRLAADDIDLAVGAATAEIAAVGEAFARAGYDDLYESDNTHANARGRLLTALVVYSVVFE